MSLRSVLVYIVVYPQNVRLNQPPSFLTRLFRFFFGFFSLFYEEFKSRTCESERSESQSSLSLPFSLVMSVDCTMMPRGFPLVPCERRSVFDPSSFWNDKFDALNLSTILLLLMFVFRRKCSSAPGQPGLYSNYNK